MSPGTVVSVPINQHPLRDIILAMIRERIKNHPRSLQKRIGPSEIGHPCDRWMAYKLNDTPEMPREKDNWRPTVGTFVHAGLAEWFEAYNDVMKALVGHDFWLIEGRVNVGHVDNGDGYDVYGSGDLYSVAYRAVVDWKIVGKSTLDEVRRKEDPGDQYRIQVQSYGSGWVERGHDVDDVIVFYLPASGALSQSIMWHQPYDPTVSVAAIDRVNQIQGAVDQLGDNVPLAMEPTAHYCDTRCEWFKANITDLRRGCPGVDVKPRGLNNLLG